MRLAGKCLRCNGNDITELDYIDHCNSCNTYYYDEGEEINAGKYCVWIHSEYSIIMLHDDTFAVRIPKVISIKASCEDIDKLVMLL